jgi:DivIVA domain-containing protein
MKKKEEDTAEAEPFAPPQSTAASHTRITPLEIQQKEFRYARFGGYKMRDVDEFLDRVTESMSALVAETERLRGGGATESPVLGTSDLDDVNRQADEIIQRARDEASRLLADARARSAALTAGAAGAAVAGATSDEERAAIGAFLAKEKEFLQSLAGLVQDHAGSVKEMARSARSTPVPAASETPKSDAPKTDAPKTGPAPVPAQTASPTAAPAAEKPDATISLPRAEEPVRAEQPAAAGARRDGGDEAGAGGDGSLRELFWGEE